MGAQAVLPRWPPAAAASAPLGPTALLICSRNSLEMLFCPQVTGFVVHKVLGCRFSQVQPAEMRRSPRSPRYRPCSFCPPALSLQPLFSVTSVTGGSDGLARGAVGAGVFGNHLTNAAERRALPDGSRPVCRLCRSCSELGLRYTISRAACRPLGGTRE